MDKKTIVEEIIIYAVLLIVSIWLLQGKVNFHIDEIYSYGLANHINGIQMLAPTDGERFSPTIDAYYSYLVVDEEWRFNYDTVWRNQKADVHPPFYYVILHTICSFFPGEFSIWYAGIINIISICLTLFFLRKIIDMLEVDRRGKLAISCIFIFSSGIGSSIAFLRMYALTMFWIILTTYVFVKTIKKNTLTWKNCIELFLIALYGSLTHYYYLIFLFFTCAIYLIYLLCYERKKIFIFLLTYVLAGFVAYWIFPSMTFHMFEGYRGEESVNNLNTFTFELFQSRFKSMNELINKQVFGGYSSLILVGVIVLYLFCIFLHKKEKNTKSDIWTWSIIILPGICYYLLVTQIAVYIDSRYIIPIYGILIISMYGILFKLIPILLDNDLTGKVIVLVGLFIISNELLTYQCDYRNFSPQWISHFNENSENGCIYIHDDSWRIQASFTQIKNYDDVTFFSEDYFKNYNNEDTDTEKLIVVVVDECDQENVIKKVMNLYPRLKEYEEIGRLGYSTTYMFSE